MMFKIRASLAFKKIKAGLKPAFGSRVIESLTAAAATFPDLPVALEELRRTNSALATAYEKALSGDVTAKLELKAAVTQWDTLFTSTANYVSIVANGDSITVSKGGFAPTKGQGTPAQKPGATKDFKATINGSKGAIIAGSKNAVPTAKAYVFVAAEDGVTINFNDGTLEILTGGKSIYVTANTQRQTEFFNLPSTTPFNVTMYALNSAGSGPAAQSQKVVTQ
ncbi:MAG: hypothetical protein JO072_16055 [Parafilimonas sp.]|nr:hypothetical protein [Parafilimonas sp.]